MGERYENIDYTEGLAVTLVVVMHAFACAGYLSRTSSGAMEGFGLMTVFAEMMYGGLFLFSFSYRAISTAREGPTARTS